MPSQRIPDHQPWSNYKEWADTFTPIWDKVLRGDQSAADGMKEARPKLENLLKTGKVSFLGNDCGCGRT